METFLSRIADYFSAQSWQVAVLAGVLGFVSLTLRNRSAHVRYLLWLMVLAKCLVPPLATVPLAVLPQRHVSMPATTPPRSIVPVTHGATPEPLARAAEYMAVRKPTLLDRLKAVTLGQWAAIGWLVGLGLFGILGVIKATRTAAWVRRQRRLPPPAVHSVITSLLHSLGITRMPRVWLIEDVSQPFVWGVVRGDIFLPASFAEVQDHECRRDILGHEVAHVLRFDAAVNALQIIAQAVFWFHPLVWWANQRIRAEREKCCDEMAVARFGASPKHYSQVIVDTLLSEHKSRRPIPSLAVVGSARNIEERIRTMLRPGKRFYKRPSVLAVTIVLLSALLVVPTTLALANRPPGTAEQEGTESHLKVLDVNFEPIRQGKNIVQAKIENTCAEEQIFRLQIYTRSPDYGRGGVGWGTSFFRNIGPKETKLTRFAFKIQGPITDATYIRLDFHNPGPATTFDMEKYFGDRTRRTKWFKRVKYSSNDLKHDEPEKVRSGSASRAQAKAVVQAFERIQTLVRDREYEQVWHVFTRDYQDAEYQISAFERFKKTMEPSHPTDSAFCWERDDFLKLQPGNVVERAGVFTLTATFDEQRWDVDFVRENDQWKIDWIGGYTPRVLGWQNWEERLLPQMQKHSTAHFDIYYFKDSTAEREIDQIARQKEQGYQQICRFLGKDSKIKIRMVLFEDGQTKHKETGHQGAGWAYGNTIVEVYNERERLDPYHETTHVLMRPFGNPPALFNEGFAVYMSERLGAHALDDLGGGQATVHQRTEELRSQGQWIELRQLLSFTGIGPESTRPPVSYAEAASFVKFLIDSYGKDKFLQAYNTLRNSDDKAVQQGNIKQLGEIFGKSLESLEQQWKDVLSGS